MSNVMKVDLSKLNQRIIDEMCRITPCGSRDGCKNPSLPDHGCPFQEEINDDHDYRCNCCGDCMGECVYDI